MGKKRKEEGRKEVFPFYPFPSLPFPSFPFHAPSIYPSRPTNDRVALKTNNLETIVALKRLSRSSPPPLISLSFSHCSCIYPLFSLSEEQNGASSEQACGQRASSAVQCSQEDFLLHYTPQSEEGRKEGEKDGVRIMWWEEGGRKRGSELAAGKPK